MSNIEQKETRQKPEVDWSYANGVRRITYCEGKFGIKSHSLSKFTSKIVVATNSVRYLLLKVTQLFQNQ